MIAVREVALEAAVASIFEKAGAPPRHAWRVAKGLVGANMAGHDSHGVVRVPAYLTGIRDRRLDPKANARIAHETATVAVIDGGSGFGQVIGEQSMDIAIAKAKTSGLSLAAIRRSYHLGRIGEWAEQCASAGLVSIHFCNVVDCGGIVAPFGGRERRMSTNPFACGVPVEGGEPIILDMATSKVAEGKVQVARNKGTQVPPQSIIDANGEPSRDPNRLYGPPPGALLHFGEHKGYGLAFIVDLLAGALTLGGANHDGYPAIASVIHNNMLSIVVDPAVTGNAAQVAAEARQFVAWVKSSAPLDTATPVLAPGEPERRHREERTRNGIPLDGQTWSQIETAAQGLGIGAAELRRIAGIA
jgi:uncharacterized oxidoreductase